MAISTLTRRRDGVLQRWDSYHEQSTFEGITDWTKELYFINAWEAAQQAIDLLVEGNLGFLPYPPRSHKPGSPEYVPELDD